MKNSINLLLLCTLSASSLFCAENQELGFWQKTQQRGAAAHQMNSKAINSSDFLDKVSYINNLGKTPINDLPHDVNIELFKYLPEKNQLNMRATSNHFKNFIDEKINAIFKDFKIKLFAQEEILKTFKKYNHHDINLFVNTHISRIKSELIKNTNIPENLFVQKIDKNIKDSLYAEFKKIHTKQQVMRCVNASASMSVGLLFITSPFIAYKAVQDPTASILIKAPLTATIGFSYGLLLAILQNIYNVSKNA